MLDLLVALSLSVVTSYHIGNSLTEDMQPEGVALLSASRGIEHNVGFHVRDSWSLQNILASPDQVTMQPTHFGTLTHALPNYTWDIVTFQPHPSNDITRLGTDLQSIKSIIDLTRSNPANANTNFYIYQGWPTLVTPYQTAWLSESPDQLNTQMTRSRQYYDNLIRRVRAETDANVYMIPTGEVFYELDVRMRAGKIPGFSSISSLFRDAIHLSYLAGRYTAGVTTFATTVGQYPIGPEIPSADDFYGPAGGLTPVQLAAFLETIRDVLDKHPYSGVSMPPPFRSDFDNNQTVDELDLELLQQSLNKQKLYDVDYDGDVDGRDFLFWQRHHAAVPTDPRFDVADLSADGIFNGDDLAHWQNSYGNSSDADVDGDADSDGRDFLIWQRSLPSDPADVNQDFLVNGAELELWQSSAGFNEAFDANDDGLVNHLDLELWQSENGRPWTYPSALSAPPLASQSSTPGEVLTVPEPAAALLLTAVLFLSSSRRANR